MKRAERLRLLSRLMQLGFVAIIVFLVLTGRYEWLSAAVVSLLISFVPNMIRRSARITLPPELNFMIVLALFLHTMGGSLGFYTHLAWWDHMTHSFSAFLIASLGFIGVVIIDKYVDSIHLPPKFLSFFIFMFTLAMGVLWEIMEFVNDQLIGTTMQYSLDDTMVDLMFDALGGLVVAIFGPFYLLGTSEDRFLERMGVEEAVAAFMSRFR